ncbi:MAG: polysaccharide biosynthesis transport protein [Blastocatellia bacterium]|jgi:succinoglycan biosynthesis transport protein ExoP|nr:polysaccharide biosynthesis transport protein [Blastocatellia bacterium]
MSESLEIRRRRAELEEVNSHYDSFELPPNGDGKRTIKTRDVLRSIRKFAWLIIALTLVGTLLTAVYEAQKPDFYVATARVQVNMENNPAIGVGGGKGNAVVVSNSVNDPAYFSTQFQILESAKLLDRVVKTLDLQHSVPFLHPLRAQNRTVWQNFARMIGLQKSPVIPAESKDDNPTNFPGVVDPDPGTNETPDEEAERLAMYVAMLRKGLTISPVRESRLTFKETRLIEIEFVHYDPIIAAKVANTIADTYVLSNLESKVESNASAGDFLQKRVAQLQNQIRSGEEQLLNYAKNHQILSLDDRQNTVVQRFSELSNRLMEAENQRNLAESEYRANSAPKAASTAIEATDSQVSALQMKQNDLKQLRVQTLAEYKEQAPEIKAIDTQIAALENQIQDRTEHAAKILITGSQSKYNQAVAREEHLRAEFERQRADVLSQNEAAINYRLLQQETETNKSLLVGLLQKYRENDVILNGTPNNVLVAERALTPQGAAGPRRAQFIMAAFVASFGLGVGLSIVLGFADDSVRTIDDVREALQTSVLAVIPSLTHSSRGRKRRLRNHNGGDGNNHETLITSYLKADPLLEAYLHLRTSILLSSAGGPPRRLVVASSQPSEGKTTTAINLATVLAQTGAKVLLIDGDLRRPRLHTVLNLSSEKGLTNLLAQHDLNEQEIFNTIEMHTQTGVSVLMAGTQSPNPTNLLGSERMRALLAILDTAFTHIIIDSPPIILFTDGVIWASLADGVLFVVRSGRSARAAIMQGQKTLQDIGAKICGVVLNDVTKSVNPYYVEYGNYGLADDTHIEKDEDGRGSGSVLNLGIH